MLFRLKVPILCRSFRSINRSRLLFSSAHKMANSKFEYVKAFEKEDILLPNTYIVVRIDGKGFHKFASTHEFTKPNDESALHLMNRCAEKVMEEVKEIFIAYGQSDEFSFVFKPSTQLFNRREAKLTTLIVSLFTSNYVYHWPHFFPAKKLQYPPSFDGRAVLYPTLQNLRDYLSWRQADCHINNLYNTTFWNLVLKGKLSEQQAEEKLRGTFAADKNEILFSEFGINYNTISEIYRKGTTIIRQQQLSEKQATIPSKYVKPEDREKGIANADGTVTITVKKEQKVLTPLYCDIIGDEFWESHPDLLHT
ncbi:Thg1 C terminal domain-containing protein, partial [Paraphysoderma sedebokerense]